MMHVSPSRNYGQQRQGTALQKEMQFYHGDMEAQSIWVSFEYRTDPHFLPQLRGGGGGEKSPGIFCSFLSLKTLLNFRN